jgi:ferritin-like metal-binding protein YciE
MNKIENLKDLFIHEIVDVYDAEKQIVEALPKMIKKCTSPQLKKSFEKHLNESEKQVERLERIFVKLEENFDTSHTCKAMKGLIKEVDDLIKMKIEPEVLDAGLIAAAQRVEHYEIAVYGTLITFAREIGLNSSIIKLLEQTLTEEKKTDAKLTDLAESRINQKALANGNH